MNTINDNFQPNQTPYQNLNANFQPNQTPYQPYLNGNFQQNQILYQPYLNGNFPQNQILYQPYLNENFLKNEKKKKNIMCLLISGIVLFSIEVLINFFVIVGVGIGLFISGECDYDNDEERRRCEEDYKKDDKKFDNAMKFVLPLIIISIITMILGFNYKKKLIILNIFCILIKISLFIGYIIYFSKLLDGEDGYMILMILPEIISDLLFFMHEILKCNIKNN